MVKTLVARGQATIHIQKDGYTISQSLGEYVFPADADGQIPSAVSATPTIQVTLGDSDFYGFSIGPVVKPAGFSSISVNNSNKTITYNIAAGTATLADHGTVSIPVIISGATYTLSFVWSKAKSGTHGISLCVCLISILKSFYDRQRFKIFFVFQSCNVEKRLFVI